MVLRNSGILCLTLKRLSNFAYDTRSQVKDMSLLKSNMLLIFIFIFMWWIAV